MSTDDLAMDIRARGDVMVVAPSGDLDESAASPLRVELIGLLEQGSTELVVDLSAASVLDSEGLAALEDVRHRANQVGGRLVLAGVGPDVLAVLRTTGLDRVFEFADPEAGRPGYGS